MFRWGTLRISCVVFRWGEKGGHGKKRSGGKNFIVHSVEDTATQRQAGAAEAGKTSRNPLFPRLKKPAKSIIPAQVLQNFGSLLHICIERRGKKSLIFSFMFRIRVIGRVVGIYLYTNLMYRSGSGKPSQQPGCPGGEQLGRMDGFLVVSLFLWWERAGRSRADALRWILMLHICS